MPVASSITLNTKVYTPRGTSNGITSWALTGDTTFGGAQSDLTESVRGPLQSGAYRTKWMLTLPKAATADTSCACVGQIMSRGKADMTFDIPSNFTAAEKQDFADRIQALVALALFDSSISIPEGSWG